MRVTLVVSGNKYTGAATMAEHSCRALQVAGVEARLIFVGGNNLERRLLGFEWAEPSLRKERRPADLRFNLAVLKSAALESDAVVCHLPHGHFLCHLAGLHRLTRVVRNFRSLSHLRRDPLHRRLNRGLAGALAANTEVAGRLGRVLPAEVPRDAVPVPLEERFRPGLDPGLWRLRLAVPPGAPTIGMVGKVSPGRGFELLLQATARIDPPVHLIIVGHGEARPELEARATSLGLAERTHWAGYQERELPALYAAMDVVLFTAGGSDHGHRAVSEAQGCARPVVAADVPGVPDLIEDGITGRITGADPDALAAAVAPLLRTPALARTLGAAGAQVAETRRFPAVGAALHSFLQTVVTG